LDANHEQQRTQGLGGSGQGGLGVGSELASYPWVGRRGGDESKSKPEDEREPRQAELRLELRYHLRPGPNPSQAVIAGEYSTM
jgi:hypothetical protein